jgi:signal transduction histidine kinase
VLHFVYELKVLANLLLNAISFTKSGGQVAVWFEKRENVVTTHIQDNGRGIPADSLPHLFTKFFRVSSSLTQDSKGTGLGLYISKSIVEMHNGKIWVESKLNEGSTFSFSLPVYIETHV